MTASQPPIDPRLLRWSASARRYVLVTAAMGVVTAGAVIVSALMVAATLAELVTDPASRDVAAQSDHLIILGVALAVRALAAVGHARYAQRASAQTIAELRIAAIDAVTDVRRTSPRELARMRGDLLTVTGRGLDALAPYLSSFIPALLLTVTVTPAVVAVIAWADLTSAIIVVVTLPLIPLFMVLIGLMTRDRTRRRLEAMNAQSAQLLDLVAGVPTLRALHRADGPVVQVRALGQTHRRTTMRALRVAFLSGAVLELLATLCVALVAVSIGLRLVHGDMTLHDGVLALILAPEVYLPLRSVGAQFHNSETGRTVAADVLDLIDRAPIRRIEQHTDAVNLRQAAVVLHQVGVRDRDGWAPRGLSLRCEPGAITVLTGANGSGKSTALQVIAGMIAPDTGWVRIGDLDPVADPEAIIGSIAWLAEPPVVLPGTVASNLALFGHPDPARLDGACRATGLDTVLAQLPAGRDTRVGCGGVGLSAGQRQRLAVTRVLAAPASVLLLDEPTAHLDERSETQVIEALRRRAADGATIVVVSHRSAVLAAADAIVTTSAVAHV
ncbi:thiol reductant ABC exporter subunit CydD [Williamsia sp. CHRR-6]|uniref:thiol reductant ABC exporter subunit CydD n=1 Tax=Williamsia sp. CHRR-6 TaxID=2835871 RepID=UPI001BD95E34|nr:thiol reductant ABC exporter subunit CydD [Williamsia sp. CHRR-6]MBT0566326.1 thiol reductant ABC exporter subunit CydD [Williamsia sp. CHRR-6]